jgi:hypothetical protein
VTPAAAAAAAPNTITGAVDPNTLTAGARPTSDPDHS